MIRSKLGLKALVLSGLVLGLMAFATSAAQAEEKASWAIKDSSGTLLLIPGANDLLPEVQVKELENKTASLHFKTGGGTLVEILCTSALLLENVKLTKEGSLTLGRASFHGCITKLNTLPSPPCTPVDGANVGLILSEKATGLMVLHKLANGTLDTLVRLKPDEGEVFAKISLGEECSIGTKVEVKGSLFVKDAESLTEEKIDRLISEGPLTNLVALNQPALIHGSALIRLVNAHVGLAWGGLPA